LRILFIAKPAPHGGRFHIPLAIGLQRLGHTVTWLGGQTGSLEHWPDELRVFPEYTLDHVDVYLDADLVVLIEHVTPEAKHLVAFLNKKRPDYVYLSGFDYRAGCDKHWGPKLNLNPRVYLKREAHPNFYDIIPFSGDAINPMYRREGTRKTISVCALLGDNDGPVLGNRRRIVQACRTFPNHHSRLLSPGQHLPLNDYINELNASVVSVSAWGVGYLCYRDMEVLAATTIPAIQRNPSHQYDDLEDCCILYRDPAELTMRIYQVIANPMLQSRMLRAKSVAMERYTPEAKARKFLELTAASV